MYVCVCMTPLAVRVSPSLLLDEVKKVVDVNVAVSKTLTLAAFHETVLKAVMTSPTARVLLGEPTKLHINNTRLRR